MCESRKGVSANQLKRVLGTSYKTSWYLCHRIRAAMKDADIAPLTGVVEVDETYIGGRRKGGKGRGTALDNKTMVLGAIQRNGEVRLRVDKRADAKTLRGFVRSTTGAGPKTIYTDDWKGYKALGGDKDTTHDSVNHSQEEWVRGQVHTNTIEGVFSLFKRSIVGAYHQVSAKHLPAYLDEFEFRFNRRRRADLFADTIRHLVQAEKMPFKALTKT
jgi:transposase-like protein